MLASNQSATSRRFESVSLEEGMRDVVMIIFPRVPEALSHNDVPSFLRLY